MAAAFALGAEGVQMGTRFVATEEAEVHEEFKRRIVKASIRDTVVTGAKLGHPARVLKTPFAKKIVELETKSFEEAEKLLLGSLRRAVVEGDVQGGSFMAGQSSGLINDIKPVKEVIKDIMEEFEKSINQLCEKRSGWWR